MRKVLMGKNARDIEFASDSLIHPSMAGSLQRKPVKSPSKMTIAEQQEEARQIDDFDEKRS